LDRAHSSLKERNRHQQQHSWRITIPIFITIIITIIIAIMTATQNETNTATTTSTDSTPAITAIADRICTAVTLSHTYQQQPTSHHSLSTPQHTRPRAPRSGNKSGSLGRRQWKARHWMKCETQSSAATHNIIGSSSSSTFHPRNCTRRH